MTQLLGLAVFALLAISALLSAPAAFALVLLMYPLEQLLQAGGGVFLSTSWLTNLLIAAIAGIAVVRLVMVTDRPLVGYLNFQLSGAIALHAWSLVTLLWTPSNESARQFIQGGYAYFVLLIVVSPMLATDVRSLGRINRSALIAGTLLAGAMISSPEFRSWSGRLVTDLGSSGRSNPLVLGELGGTLVICSVLFRATGMSLLVKICRIAAFPLGAILVLQSGSRGQLIFALLIATIFYPIARKLTNIRSFVGGVAALGTATVVFVFLAPIFVTGYGLSRWDVGSVEGSALGRVGNVGDLLTAFRGNPVAWIFGLGYNAFSSVSTNSLDGYAHNLSAEVLAELGLPMFAIYVAMIWVSTRDGVAMMRESREDPESRASIGLFLALIAYQFLLDQKQGTLWYDSTLFMLVVVLARIRSREVHGLGTGEGLVTGESNTQ